MILLKARYFIIQVLHNECESGGLQLKQVLVSYNVIYEKETEHVIGVKEKRSNQFNLQLWYGIPCVLDENIILFPRTRNTR